MHPPPTPLPPLHPRATAGTLGLGGEAGGTDVTSRCDDALPWARARCRFALEASDNSAWKGVGGGASKQRSAKTTAKHKCAGEPRTPVSKVMGRSRQPRPRTLGPHVARSSGGRPRLNHSQPPAGTGAGRAEGRGVSITPGGRGGWNVPGLSRGSTTTQHARLAGAGRTSSIYAGPAEGTDQPGRHRVGGSEETGSQRGTRLVQRTRHTQEIARSIIN